MKKHTFLTGLLRWIVAGVFIFSGFVKAVDPWGTAIKFGEYFNAFGMGWLSGAEYAFSILLSASEMLLGLCLLFRIREKSVTTLLTILLGFFTLLTFVLALWNPVADCGCFGDFVKLTNWQTFFKNVILLLFTVVLWRTAWKQPFRQHNRYASTVEWSMIFFFGLLSSGIGLYSLRHLPPIDFLPFRIGVNIPSQMEGYGNDTQTTLIYKDRTTGQQREFDLADTTWYDTLRWEYVDTRIVENNRKRRSEIQDFSVFNADENYAPTLLASTREVFLIALNPIDRPLSSICSRQIEPNRALCREIQLPGRMRHRLGVTRRRENNFRRQSYPGLQHGRHDAENADPRPGGTRTTERGDDPRQMELPRHPEFRTGLRRPDAARNGHRTARPQQPHLAAGPPCSRLGVHLRRLYVTTRQRIIFFESRSGNGPRPENRGHSFHNRPSPDGMA